MRTPVLIVGGGPVGLALAGELGWRGIACTLLEQSDGTVVTPKMNEVNIRTMEFCRRWGIAEAVQACPFPHDYPLDVAFVTSLAGYELGRLPRPPRMHAAAELHSPVRLQVCPQMWFDPILQRFAQSFAHVTLRYRTRLEFFAVDRDGVAAEALDLAANRRERIEAKYLVACDGANSMVRRALGIPLTGGPLGHPLHLYFRAPGLLEACGRHPAVFFVNVDRAGVWANLRIIDPIGALWRLMVLDSDGTLTPETIDRAGYLRRALGREFAVEWLGASIWTRRSAVAKRYSEGRVFLAGDAAHQLSPTGALGMNTGIGDAVDLGWKLAAVLGGWGGAGLLASYDQERRPIGVRNTDLTAEFYFEHGKFGEEIELIDAKGRAGESARAQIGEALVRRVGRMFRTLGLQIGYRYENSPICVADASSPIPDDPEHFVASARPGSRAPHVGLGESRSILDLYGRSFVLLRLGEAPPKATAFETAAGARGVPLETVAVADPAAARCYERALVLVRPDGHVAWRANAPPPDAGAVLDTARGAA